jgi:hypothetical protein
MYKKQIEQVVTVALKYFFDLDFNSCNHVLITLLVIAGFFKFSMNNILGVLSDGLLTIKEDALSIKANILSYKERWMDNAAQG